MSRLSAALRRRFDPLLNRPPRAATVAAWEDRAALGRYGEAVAARWLAAQGLKLLFRNFAGPDGGELDLVLRHGEALVFCEVKTRRSLAHGRPHEAVTADKRLLIRRGARLWLNLLHRPVPPLFRFDIVEILAAPDTAPQVSWLQNSFDFDER